ncbi:MAG TPA: hypothetical protein VF457_04340 [Burkholderiaceae bacterium]
MRQMAEARRSGTEVGYITGVLRRCGDPLAKRLDEPLLRREVEATLAACDRLGLTSDADRLSLCLLEITTFAGMRDVRKLRGLLDYAGGPSEARMFALLQAMPPRVWEQIAAQAPEVRRQRGIG